MIMGETVIITDDDTPAEILEKMLDQDTCVVLDLRKSLNNSLENIVVLEQERQKQEQAESERLAKEEKTSVLLISLDLLKRFV